MPRKSVFGIPDDFFIDHFADLPGHWRELLIEWAFLFARFLDLINPNWKPKWVRDRTGGSKDDHDISKAITKFIGFFVTVFVSLLVMVCRATFAAAIGLINTMIVCILLELASSSSNRLQRCGTSTPFSSEGLAT